MTIFCLRITNQITAVRSATLVTGTIYMPLPSAGALIKTYPWRGYRMRLCVSDDTAYAAGHVCPRLRFFLVWSFVWAACNPSLHSRLCRPRSGLRHKGIYLTWPCSRMERAVIGLWQEIAKGMLSLPLDLVWAHVDIWKWTTSLIACSDFGHDIDLDWFVWTERIVSAAYA